VVASVFAVKVQVTCIIGGLDGLKHVLALEAVDVRSILIQVNSREYSGPVVVDKPFVGDVQCLLCGYEAEGVRGIE
jgi:hypothetical protein